MKDFRVLIVDDNSEQAVCMANMLQREGYSATVVNAGEDAIAYVLSEPCDLAVIDARLAAIDGVEIFLAIRRLRPDIACIMINAQGVDKVLKELVSQGELVILQKPFQLAGPSEIITAVRREVLEALPA